MIENKKNTGKRFDEEFKRGAARLTSQADKTDEQVARDLAGCAWSVSRWRREFGLSKAAGGVRLGYTPRPAPTASVAELERQVRTLQRENADLREQRAILKKPSPSSRPPRAEDGGHRPIGGRTQRA